MRLAIVASICPHLRTHSFNELSPVMGEVLLVQRIQTLLCGWRINMAMISEEGYYGVRCGDSEDVRIREVGERSPE